MCLCGYTEVGNQQMSAVAASRSFRPDIGGLCAPIFMTGARRTVAAARQSAFRAAIHSDSLAD